MYSPCGRNGPPTARATERSETNIARVLLTTVARRGAEWLMSVLQGNGIESILRGMHRSKHRRDFHQTSPFQARMSDGLRSLATSPGDVACRAGAIACPKMPEDARLKKIVSTT